MKKRTIISAITAAFLAVSFAACNSSDDGVDGINGTDGVDGQSASFVKWEFEELSAPVTDLEKTSIRSTTKITNNADGITDTIGFTELMATTDTDNGETFGLLKDHNDVAMTFTDGSPYICNGTNAGLGSGLDHSSILEKDGRIFMVSQFECEVGAMYGMELEQNATTGALAVKKDSLQYISQKEGYGGWVHCAGVTTPWNSHLGSEEYEPNARAVEADLNTTTMLTGNKYYDEVTKYYWKDENNANTANNNNPYFYGWIPEVTVAGATATPSFSYTKHFSMGRAAWELAYVMPDEKTAYLSDDGTNVGFYMYVADTAKNLSAGTLYAAKWIQTSNVGAGAADLMWIKLGHATDAEIKTIVATEPKFSDIFNVETPNVDDTCPTAGFSFVNTAMGKECLQVKSGQETAAAYLETRRYAAMQGATTEFRKEEGITFNPDNSTVYVAMSEVRKGMTDGLGDIQLAENKCGAVYGLDVYGSAETAYDSVQNVINSNYVVKNMHSVVEGSPAVYPVGSAYESYTCSVNGIANPDNVTYLEGENILAIGEDTSAHPNDFVWSFDTTSGDLTRLVSTPYGSETTSPFWYKDINGWGYLSLVTQHPFGETSTSDVENSLTPTSTESSIGIVGPFDFTVGDAKGSR
ncbi:alkaline phosphatase PhoX [Sulfurimonas microaerophilic]|uniref:alkaline phosphatase PhoX n=1 Tax=Sulfurimonas microaerophilic TaxID=3058392 RepID=UPI002714A2E8|nr:alkaline phosphatase PhoX [Sulfurimonas sp. hsl 1-7]